MKNQRMIVNLLQLTIICVGLLIGNSITDHHSNKHGSNNKHNNVLLLLTDDQDVLIGGMDHMQYVKEHLINMGVVGTNMYVHTPICCPSRSSILSGKYLHNGGNAINNSLQGNCYGEEWKNGNELKTFAVYAQQIMGYQTGFVGKYLNMYGLQQDDDDDNNNNNLSIPPGWDRFMGLVGNSRYYNYSTIVSDDGGKTVYKHTYGDTYSHDYFPDLVANRTLEMIHQFQNNSNNKPYLIVTAWPTPHAPFTAAPQDYGKFVNIKAYRTPNWNTSHEQNLQKHWMMRRLAPIDLETELFIDQVYQNRTEALLSIDRHIHQFVNNINDVNNTYIIYTSDNGWQLGQHRLRSDKRQLYEHDILVPLIVRGPGITPNTTISQLILNIDIAPTILDMIGYYYDNNNQTSSYYNKQDDVDDMDGRSFLPLLLLQQQQTTELGQKQETIDWRKSFLVSYHGEGDPNCGMDTCPPVPSQQYHGGDTYNNTYHCVRTIDDNNNKNTMYCRFIDNENFIEYYNLNTDPWQLYNAVHELTSEEKFHYEARLTHLRTCSGKSCREKN